MKKLLFVLFFTMFPVLAHGATYYVAKMGSDSNSCNSAQSQSTPKLTINAGAGCLSAGDTLIVKAGTYSEILDNVIPSGTASTPTTVRSEVQYGAIIQPGAGNQGNLCGTVGIVCFNNRHYITFDGFITDGTGLGPVYHIYFQASASHDITVQNNELRYGRDVNSTTNVIGIVDNHGPYAITIRGNKIHDLGTGAVAGQSFYSYGMYLHINNSMIENNEIYNCSGWGMHWYNTVAGDASGNIVRKNTVHDNGIVGQKGGILYAADGDNNTLYNNHIYKNGGEGVIIGSYGMSVNNNSVYNNTIYANTGTCIYLGNYSPITNTKVQNNICYQNGSDNVTVTSGSGNTIDHNLLGTNPLFVNAAAADFSPKAGSPAIDAGVVIAGLPYKGSAPDLGALESGASLPSPINLRLVAN